MSRVAHIESPAIGAETITRPYPPSWVDRFTDWVRQLPIPGWLVYIGLALPLVLIGAAANWIDGYNPLGTFNLSQALSMAAPIIIMAQLHYLDDTASKALATFRPALNASDAEFEELQYRLTTMPRRQTLLWSLVGGVFLSLLSWATFRPREKPDLLTSSVAFKVEQVPNFLTGMVVGAVIFHTLRQLRLVSDIYTRYTRVDLFQLRPLFAFSGLTARTGVVLLIGSYTGSAIQDYSAVRYGGPSSMLEQPIAVVNSVLGIGLALACFVLPLLGIHRLLDEENERAQSDASRRMAGLIKELDRRIDAGDIRSMDEMKSALESLVIKQNVLDKISTWPWSVGSLRLVSTAILLPIILYGIQRLLAIFFGF